MLRAALYISKASAFWRFGSAAEGHSDTAAIDGVRRLYFFLNSPDLSLVIMVVEAQQDISLPGFRPARDPHSASIGLQLTEPTSAVY